MNRTEKITLSSDEDTVEFSGEYQGVTLWLGDGFPVNINDELTREDVRDLVEHPMQRRVLAARLRVLSEWLDEDPLLDMLARSQSVSADS